MVTTKQQVVQKAIDNYIENQERGLEVAQKALAMHQKMHRPELQEAEALGKPVSEVEHLDEEARGLSDEIRDGQREIEATRQRIEEARTARLNGSRASEDFLNGHQGDNWADQTALDEFGVTPPEDSGLGPVEGYEPGRPAGDDVSELPVTEPAEPMPSAGEPPAVDAGAGKTPTLRTGDKAPDWTLKPGQAQPTPGPSAPPVGPDGEPGDQLPPAPEPGGAEPSEGPGVVSRIAKWLAGTSLVKAAQVGFEVVKGRFKKVVAVVGAVIAVGGLIYTFWPSGGAPEPRPPEPPGVQAPPTPAAPEPPPPNPFVPPHVPEPVPPNPFGGPESAPPNPFGGPESPPPNPYVPPHVPEPAPPPPFEPGKGTNSEPVVPPAAPAPPNPFEPGQHGSNPGGTDTGGGTGSDGSTGGHSGTGGTDTGGGTDSDTGTGGHSGTSGTGGGTGSDTGTGGGTGGDTSTGTGGDSSTGTGSDTGGTGTGSDTGTGGHSGTGTGTGTGGNTSTGTGSDSSTGSDTGTGGHSGTGGDTGGTGTGSDTGTGGHSGTGDTGTGGG
ncbi:hypothetical protein AB0L88_38515 [Saccharopolyspora shandongensis]|uniref:hypothetical protein n=1 Tax=Saccharopolyspora shandongensis TaxID=418495 RepID=UPI0034498134